MAVAGAALRLEVDGVAAGAGTGVIQTQRLRKINGISYLVTGMICGDERIVPAGTGAVPDEPV